MIPSLCYEDTLSIDYYEVFSDRDVVFNTVETIEWSDNECTDTDYGAEDDYGDTCFDYFEDDCGYDEADYDDFESNSMCCICGGGIQGIVSSAKSLTSCGTYSWEFSSVPPNTPGLTFDLD